VDLATESNPRTETISYVRADKHGWDLYNLFLAPLRELTSHENLIRNIISRDLKVRYKRSVLGVFWTLLAPMLSMLVMWFVFTRAMKVQIEHYAVFLLSGIICWNFLVQSSAAGGASILNASSLIQKIRLPRAIFPIAACFNNLVNFFFSFCALLIVILITGAPFYWTMLLTPLMLIPLFLFASGWALAMSAIVVFFRDVQYMVEISLQAAFYLTPVLWAPHMAPEKYVWILSINPMAKFIHLFRCVVYEGTLPSLQTYLVALGIGLGMFLIGWIFFQRRQRMFSYFL
jgi:ABC-2 type transport system permease protein